jgi:hypothetical protein
MTRCDREDFSIVRWWNEWLLYVSVDTEVSIPMLVRFLQGVHIFDSFVIPLENLFHPSAQRIEDSHAKQTTHDIQRRPTIAGAPSKQAIPLDALSVEHDNGTLTEFEPAIHATQHTG